MARWIETYLFGIFALLYVVESLVRRQPVVALHETLTSAVPVSLHVWRSSVMFLAYVPLAASTSLPLALVLVLGAPYHAFVRKNDPHQVRGLFLATGFTLWMLVLVRRDERIALAVAVLAVAVALLVDAPVFVVLVLELFLLVGVHRRFAPLSSVRWRLGSVAFLAPLLGASVAPLVLVPAYAWSTVRQQVVNHAGTLLCATAHETEYPESVDALRDVVLGARHVRALGGRHSWYMQYM